jgi:hypothetical protein
MNVTDEPGHHEGRGEEVKRKMTDLVKAALEIERKLERANELEEALLKDLKTAMGLMSFEERSDYMSRVAKNSLAKLDK